MVGKIVDDGTYQINQDWNFWSKCGLDHGDIFPSQQCQIGNYVLPLPHDYETMNFKGYGKDCISNIVLKKKYWKSYGVMSIDEIEKMDTYQEIVDVYTQRCHELKDIYESTIEKTPILDHIIEKIIVSPYRKTEITEKILKLNNSHFRPHNWSFALKCLIKSCKPSIIQLIKVKHSEIIKQEFSNLYQDIEILI